MKGKLFAALTAVACLATATICTGCGDETSDSMESTTTTAPVATETTVLETTTTTISETTATTTEQPKREIDCATIGEDTGGEFAYHVYIENHTGKDIVGMSLKCVSEEDWYYADDFPFPDENLLDEDSVFKDEETVLFYYDMEEDLKTFENPYYEIQITFDDGIVTNWYAYGLFYQRQDPEFEMGCKLGYREYIDFGDLDVFELIVENYIEITICADYLSESPIWWAPDFYYFRERYDNTGLMPEKTEEEAEEEITYYEYESNQTAADQTPVEDNSNSGNSVDDGCIGEDGIFNDDSADSAADDTVDDGCIGDEGLFNDDDSNADDGCIGDDGLFN